MAAFSLVPKSKRPAERQVSKITSKECWKGHASNDLRHTPPFWESFFQKPRTRPPAPLMFCQTWGKEKFQAQGLFFYTFKAAITLFFRIHRHRSRSRSATFCRITLLHFQERVATPGRIVIRDIAPSPLVPANVRATTTNKPLGNPRTFQLLCINWQRLMQGVEPSFPTPTVDANHPSLFKLAEIPSIRTCWAVLILLKTPGTAMRTRSATCRRSRPGCARWSSPNCLMSWPSTRRGNSFFIPWRHHWMAGHVVLVVQSQSIHPFFQASHSPRYLLLHFFIILPFSRSTRISLVHQTRRIIEKGPACRERTLHILLSCRCRCRRNSRVRSVARSSRRTSHRIDCCQTPRFGRPMFHCDVSTATLSILWFNPHGSQAWGNSSNYSFLGALWLCVIWHNSQNFSQKHFQGLRGGLKSYVSFPDLDLFDSYVVRLFLPFFLSCCSVGHFSDSCCSYISLDCFSSLPTISQPKIQWSTWCLLLGADCLHKAPYQHPAS